MCGAREAQENRVVAPCHVGLISACSLSPVFQARGYWNLTIREHGLLQIQRSTKSLPDSHPWARRGGRERHAAQRPEASLGFGTRFPRMRGQRLRPGTSRAAQRLSSGRLRGRHVAFDPVSPGPPDGHRGHAV